MLLFWITPSFDAASEALRREGFLVPEEDAARLRACNLLGRDASSVPEEFTFVLDGLLEHDTEMAPRTCFTDSHGFTNVVLVAALLGFELAPRIRALKDQTLYRTAPAGGHPRRDPLLNGVIRPHLIVRAWDEAMHVIASLRAQTVSASLIPPPARFLRPSEQRAAGVGRNRPRAQDDVHPEASSRTPLPSCMKS